MHVYSILLHTYITYMLNPSTKSIQLCNFLTFLFTHRKFFLINHQALSQWRRKPGGGGGARGENYTFHKHCNFININ